MPAWYNPYLFVPFVAWLAAQTIKFIQSLIKGKADARLFYASGGMPSAHSAAVVAVAVTALILEGFASPLFGITGLFAAVVIYDSFGVRRASGDQAIAINAMLRSFSKKKKGELAAIKLREVLGHKPEEVIVGSLIGAVIAITLNAGKINL